MACILGSWAVCEFVTLLSVGACLVQEVHFLVMLMEWESEDKKALLCPYYCLNPAAPLFVATLCLLGRFMRC